MFILIALSAVIQAEKSSTGPVYHFGPGNWRTYNINLNERPTFIKYSNYEPSLYEVLEKEGWRSTQRSNYRQVYNRHPYGTELRGISQNQVASQILGGNWVFSKRNIELSLRLQQQWGVLNYDISPWAYLMPEERSLLEKKTSNTWYIAKAAWGSRGKGITLVRRADEVGGGEQVVQQYITNPLTVHGHKFDMRVSMAVTSVDPLIAYVHEEGYLKIATNKYQAPTKANARNTQMHITNLEVPGKREPYYITSQQQAVMTFGELWEYLYNHQYLFDKDVPRFASAKALRLHYSFELRETMQKALVAMYPDLLKANQQHPELMYQHPIRRYAVFGADVMFLTSGEFKIIEINRTPMMITESRYKYDAQRYQNLQMVRDELNLVGIPVAGKRQSVNPLWGSAGHRTGIAWSLTRKEVEAEKVRLRPTAFERSFIDQLNDENRRSGGFVRIFPTVSRTVMGELRRNTYLNWFMHQWVK